MYPSRPSPLFVRCWIIAAISVAMLGTAIAAAPNTSIPKPSPALDPAQVVRIQLGALAHVDEPVHDAGLAIVFSFASPGNQAQTGPLPKFVELVRKSYPEMLNHRSAVLIKTVIDGDQALQGVELIDRSGTAHRYVFVLTRQVEPPYRDCWMTDGVYPAPGEKPAQET